MKSLTCNDRCASTQLCVHTFNDVSVRDSTTLATETNSSNGTTTVTSRERYGVPVELLLNSSFCKSECSRLTSDRESIDGAIMYNDSFFDPIDVDVGSFDDGSNYSSDKLECGVPIPRRGRSMSIEEYPRCRKADFILLTPSDEYTVTQNITAKNHSVQHRRASSLPPQAHEVHSNPSRFARSKRRNVSPRHVKIPLPTDRILNNTVSRSFQNESGRTSYVTLTSVKANALDGIERGKGKQLQEMRKLSREDTFFIPFKNQIIFHGNNEPVQSPNCGDSGVESLLFCGAYASSAEAKEHKGTYTSRKIGKTLNRSLSLQSGRGLPAIRKRSGVRNSSSHEYHDRFEEQNIEKESTTHSMINHQLVSSRNNIHSHASTRKEESSNLTGISGRQCPLDTITLNIPDSRTGSRQSSNEKTTLSQFDSDARWRAESDHTSPRRPSRQQYEFVKEAKPIRSAESYDTSPRRLSRLLNVSEEVTSPICRNVNKVKSFPVSPSRRSRTMRNDGDNVTNLMLYENTGETKPRICTQPKIGKNHPHFVSPVRYRSPVKLQSTVVHQRRRSNSMDDLVPRPYGPSQTIEHYRSKRNNIDDQRGSIQPSNTSENCSPVKSIHSSIVHHIKNQKVEDVHSRGHIEHDAIVSKNDTAGTVHKTRGKKYPDVRFL